eukprot:5467085-Pleurochrysis_carterae.AAC.4
MLGLGMQVQLEAFGRQSLFKTSAYSSACAPESTASTYLRANFARPSCQAHGWGPPPPPAPRASHQVSRRVRLGESANVPDAGGTTVLHLAVRAGKRRLVHELLSSHGAVPVADSKGYTPWLYAAQVSVRGGLQYTLAR